MSIDFSMHDRRYAIWKNSKGKEFVKNVKNKSKLTWNELAEKLDVPKNTLKQWALEHSAMPMNKLEAMCKLVSLDISKISPDVEEIYEPPRYRVPLGKGFQKDERTRKIAKDGNASMRTKYKHKLREWQVKGGIELSKLTPLRNIETSVKTKVRSNEEKKILEWYSANGIDVKYESKVLKSGNTAVLIDFVVNNSIYHEHMGIPDKWYWDVKGQKIEKIIKTHKNNIFIITTNSIDRDSKLNENQNVHLLKFGDWNSLNETIKSIGRT